MKINLFWSFCSIFFLAISCTVSFVDRSIDYSLIKTFNIDQFSVKDAIAPPTSGLTFSEQLKTRILNNTKLSYVQDNSNADLLFSGAVIAYRLEAISPQANQTVALQRLTIQISVSHTNKSDKTGKSDWNENFSRFANFPADQDLSSIENQLIEEVYDQVLDDVFNRAFSGW